VSGAVISLVSQEGREIVHGDESLRATFALHLAAPRQHLLSQGTGRREFALVSQQGRQVAHGDDGVGVALAARFAAQRQHPLDQQAGRAVISLGPE
jgi:hypothetical protein